jgi:membrane protein
MAKWLDQLEDGLFVRSRDMPGPWGPILRVVRYPAALARDWLHGEISVRAMSLAYTTLLSVVPLLVFSFSILKGLGARGDLHYILHNFFKPLGGAADQLTESVLQFVTNMRGDLLGSLGLAFLVYTVITTIQKVESSFNFVWHVDRPRSFARRFTEYLSVMILGPLMLAVALGLLGTVEHSPFALWVDAVPTLQFLFGAAGDLVPYLIVTLVFTFMYQFIPNTKVNWRAALIGGVTAGIMWALMGRIFTTVIVRSSNLVAVYTGFAIVLTTLIWVYVSWLILLIGAQLAFYLQHPQYLRHGQDAVELTAKDREQVALAVMFLIARDYAAGRTPWNPTNLASELELPAIALSPVLGALERAGFLLATERENFVPGRNLEGIKLADILETVRADNGGRMVVTLRAVGPAAEAARAAQAAMLACLDGKSLAQMSQEGS